MCVTSATADLYPVTTNVGVGQCAGVAGAGAEIHSLHGTHHTLIPASIAAAAEGGDDAAACFDLLFGAGSGGDDTPCEGMQMMMQEFVADTEGRSVSLRHLREEV
ncbi:hypothetical protein NEMBOFW57_009098 [Staphylotrichum longicolle]|uniref:Uncharacterized protein n=1 Tax=Staphylotrichum longicolle TaxID=669026 RepID=A0AAD4ESH0_9PEZI|nr:hypothetical protein NEMBOFW57_009098 [Staphylotrichum longicolle]